MPNFCGGPRRLASQLLSCRCLISIATGLCTSRFDRPGAWIREAGSRQGEAEQDGAGIVEIRIGDVFGIPDPVIGLVELGAWQTLQGVTRSGYQLVRFGSESISSRAPRPSFAGVVDGLSIAKDKFAIGQVVVIGSHLAAGKRTGCGPADRLGIDLAHQLDQLFPCDQRHGRCCLCRNGCGERQGGQRGEPGAARSTAS